MLSVCTTVLWHVIEEIEEAKKEIVTGMLVILGVSAERRTSLLASETC
jgi:hypothetical protein